MLLDFSVKNFKVFQNEIKFSMIGNKKIVNDDNIWKINNMDIVKSSIIYGPNNSGKSNLGAAIMDITFHLGNNYDSDDEMYEGYSDDLKYADIFDRKWGKLDPLHPQSYLDFYDQQIWNAGVGGYIGGDGEYHNLKIKEAEDKANEFIEMAEKIAKKEGIKVEDVDLYKVKELLSNPQKASEYFAPPRTYEMRDTTNDPFEFNMEEQLNNMGRLVRSGIADFAEHPVRNTAALITGIDRLAKTPNIERTYREIYHIEGTVSEPAGVIEQPTSIFDNISYFFIYFLQIFLI